MKKNIIRLTESQLHKVIKESVNKILKENYPWGAEFDPRAPYNEPDYSDVYDITARIPTPLGVG